MDSNYTNKCITFNKGEHVGHLEPPIEGMQQIWEDSESLTAHSITVKKMMAKKVEPDPFKLPHHKLKKDIQTKLEDLLKEYQSQFAQDETTIRTTPLTKMKIDIGNLNQFHKNPIQLWWNITNRLRMKLTNSWKEKWYEEADPVGQHPL